MHSQFLEEESKFHTYFLTPFWKVSLTKFSQKMSFILFYVHDFFDVVEQYEQNYIY